VLTTNQKGAIAETAIAHRAIRLGIEVYRPVVEGGRYDLVFGLKSGLLRIQSKWASRHGDVIVVECRSCRRNRDGFIRRRYTADEIDAFAAYCMDVDRCFILPIARFRLAPPFSCDSGRLGTTRRQASTGPTTTTSCV
jgi:PD-(D/E)XK endonuclease